MAWLTRNWGFVAAALAIAVVVHLASVMFLPRFVMSTAIARMEAAGGLNTMAHGARATAASRLVVRPSPDLFYSSCPFDLSKTPRRGLRVRADNMPATYWSVSVFDAETNNVYVLNDRQAKDGAMDFVLAETSTKLDAAAPRKVAVPTSRGIVLFRTLIDDETRLRAIDAARRHARCESY